MDDVPEDNCVVCGRGPEAERARRRQEHFSTDYVEIAIDGVCARCQLAFWQAITGYEAPPKH